MPTASTAAARVIDKLSVDELRSILGAVVAVAGQEQPGCQCSDCQLQRFLRKAINGRQREREAVTSGR